MLAVDHPKELLAHVSKPLGTSAWITVTQAMIDDFARCTGDDNWIHIDVPRAAREMPGGKTIAHGFLTLSLTPQLTREILEVRQAARFINYGVDRLRFISPVPAGSRIRLSQTLSSGEAREDGGYRIVLASTVEIADTPRPAAIFDKIVLIYPR
ncbi:MAG: MaoC family dehydratase [Rhodobacteraceae bacterium]|nr:MaoC family dehydratase [Paracoccaceae bacterium]